LENREELPLINSNKDLSEADKNFFGFAEFIRSFMEIALKE